MENVTRARKALSYLQSVERRLINSRNAPERAQDKNNLKYALAELRNAMTLIRNMTFTQTREVTVEVKP